LSSFIIRNRRYLCVVFFWNRQYPAFLLS
jgi:hypothetical protein